MTTATRRLVLVLGATAAVGAILVVRHIRNGMGRRVPGGILIADARLYDAVSHRLLLGALFDRIAADVAANAPAGGRVLEVGCGPGHLSFLLARRHGLEVTGLDLDPAMIERARANASDGVGSGPNSTFLVGDVASLPSADASFDVVVSTLSMHHWSDPEAGLSEIGRVLRPGGRALVWDFRAGRIPLHGRMPDPARHAEASSLDVVSATPWRWPWRFSLIQRIELVRSDGARRS